MIFNYEVVLMGWMGFLAVRCPSVTRLSGIFENTKAVWDE